MLLPLGENLIKLSVFSTVFTRVGIGNNVKMTTGYQFDDHSHSQAHKHEPERDSKHTNESTGSMDRSKCDRFELLSAYLDGEVTAAERRQVEEWLAKDLTTQQLYARLLKIRQGLRTLPVPEQQTPEETTGQVLARIRRRTRMVVLGGGAAIAACAIGALSGLLPGGLSPMPQLAQKPATQQNQSQAQSEPDFTKMVAITLNDPVIRIPKAPENLFGNTKQKMELQGGYSEHEIN
ncbi:MAG: zf-HC2 domain-containing protein [Nostocaceae cyanobacterium]|nr:zf-HC2 domain-containing protein [Nostocaceae cyanobacterium]